MTRPRRFDDPERGSLSLFAAILTPAYLALLGLVVDGGYTIAARARATNQAENAARQGANALDETDLRAGLLRLDPTAARDAASSYLDRTGYAGEVDATPDAVTIVVTIRRSTSVLKLFGVDTLTVHGHATALPLRSDGGGP